MFEILYTHDEYVLGVQRSPFGIFVDIKMSIGFNSLRLMDTALTQYPGLAGQAVRTSIP